MPDNTSTSTERLSDEDLRHILARHVPRTRWNTTTEGLNSEEVCACDHAYPCDTVKAAREALFRGTDIALLSGDLE